MALSFVLAIVALAIVAFAGVICTAGCDGAFGRGRLDDIMFRLTGVMMVSVPVLLVASLVALILGY
jgi:hypothetical protein